jgi:hypothetical protein
MARTLTDRDSKSLVYPGMDIPPGSWWCLACPDHQLGLTDPLVPALEHRSKFHHPVLATKEEKPDGQDHGPVAERPA